MKVKVTLMIKIYNIALCLHLTAFKSQPITAIRHYYFGPLSLSDIMALTFERTPSRTPWYIDHDMRMYLWRNHTNELFEITVGAIFVFDRSVQYRRVDAIRSCAPQCHKIDTKLKPINIYVQMYEYYSTLRLNLLYWGLRKTIKPKHEPFSLTIFIMIIIKLIHVYISVDISYKFLLHINSKSKL